MGPMRVASKAFAILFLAVSVNSTLAVDWDEVDRLASSVQALRDALQRAAKQRGVDRSAVLAKIDQLIEAAGRNPDVAGAKLGEAYALVRGEIRHLAEEKSRPVEAVKLPLREAGDPASFERVRATAGALRDALLRLSQEAGRAGAATQVEAADRILATADADAAAGRWAAAQQHAQRALDIAKTGVRQIREGTTQVRTLAFATPADEYLYELDRYQSYRLLVNGIEPPAEVAGSFLALGLEAEALFVLAEQQAGASNYTGGIKLLEDASRKWIAALRAVGVAVPE